MEVFEKDISLLKEYPKNNRKHSEDHIRKIAESIKRFGWRKPIEIDINNYIVAGHGRLKASKMLGLKTVPVVVTKDLDINNKAYRIFDNKITESPEWDFENLEIEIQELKDEDFELESLGLDDFEINLEDQKEVQEVDLPEVAETNIKVGDLIELDQHRVLCGDATLEESYRVLMDGKKADMVFTDPPYGVDYDGGHFHSGNVNIKRAREKLVNDRNDDIYTKAIPLIAKYCLGACYTWFADSKPLQLYQSVLKIGQIHALIIWHKTNATYGALNANYKKRHEPLLYWKPKKNKLNFIGSTTESTIWEIKKDPSNNFHPTQKPIELPVRAIQNHKADIILDCFLGSGSTLIASEQLGRTCYGMELEPKYCQVIIDRYLKLKPDAIIKINGEICQKQDDQNLSLPNNKN